MSCRDTLFASTIQPLTTVLHCAANLIKNLSPHDHVTPTLRELYWLRIPTRINFKICLPMYRVHTNSSPPYITLPLHLSNPASLYDLHLSLIYCHTITGPLGRWYSTHVETLLRQ